MARRYAGLRAVSPVGPGGRLVVASAGFEASAQDAGERVRQPPQRVVALGPVGRRPSQEARAPADAFSADKARAFSADKARAFGASARRPLRAGRAATAVLLPGARVVGLVAAWSLRALPPVRRRGSPPGSAGGWAPVTRPRRAGTGRSQRPGAGRSSPPPALAGP